MEQFLEILLSRRVGLSVALLVVVVYAVPFHKKNNIDFTGAFAIFISIAAIHTGLKVISIGYSIEKLQIKGVGEIDLNYLIIGAIATIWFGVAEIWTKFKKKISES